MYYFNKGHIDTYHKLWTANSNVAITARRRPRYAERKKDGLMMALTGEINIEPLNVECF